MEENTPCTIAVTVVDASAPVTFEQPESTEKPPLSITKKGVTNAD